MLRKRGIVRKTFLFSAFLITLVTLISFAALYFAMPRFYHYKKERTFQTNLGTLVASLQNAHTQDEYADIISDFSQKNNANVLSFDKNNMMLPTVSTPYVSMKGEGETFFTAAKGKDEKGNSTYSIIIRQQVTDNSSYEVTPKEKESAIAIRSFIGKSDNVISLRGEVGTPIVDYVMVSGTLQPIDEAKDVILSLIPYVFAISIVLGLLLSWFYAKQISKPILLISDATEKMERMEQNAYSGIRSDDELGLLSRNLDALYTSLRENIESLKREMDKVNRLERSKTEMMQSASHELKTPIAALNGMIEGMLDNIGVYRDKEKYLLECKGQTEKLSMLVGEILNASKSDFFEEDLAPSEIQVDGLVKRVLDEYDVQLGENGLKVTAALTPVMIETDEAVLYRALSNIISNAARYTGEGGEIRVSVFEDEAGKQLIVENQCTAIPADEIVKLFEPFYTRSYSRDKAKSGTGLGLYIVKRNLEQLGISYTAETGELGFKISLTL